MPQKGSFFCTPQKWPFLTLKKGVKFYPPKKAVLDVVVGGYPGEGRNYKIENKTPFFWPFWDVLTPQNSSKTRILTTFVFLAKKSELQKPDFLPYFQNGPFLTPFLTLFFWGQNGQKWPFFGLFKKGAENDPQKRGQKWPSKKGPKRTSKTTPKRGYKNGVKKYPLKMGPSVPPFFGSSIF